MYKTWRAVTNKFFIWNSKNQAPYVTIGGILILVEAR